MNKSNRLIQRLNRLARSEKPQLEAPRLLARWERSRWTEIFRHLDPFILRLAAGLLVLVALVGLIGSDLLSRAGMFSKPRVNPVLDFRLREKYYKKPLSGTYGLFFDQSRVWLGTRGDGVHQYRFQPRIWKRYTRASTRGLLVGDTIEEICVDPSNAWIRAGKPGLYGLSRFRTDTGEWRKIIGNRLFPMENLEDITVIEPGTSDITWVGTGRFGINRYNALTRSWELADSLLSHTRIVALRGNSHCFLAGTPRGLFRLDSYMSPRPRPEPLNARDILQVERGERNDFYYLTARMEIGRVPAGGERAVPIIPEETNFFRFRKNPMQDNQVSAVAMDPGGHFWIGTRSMGLAFYNRNRHSWFGFNTGTFPDFPNDTILSVAAGPWGGAAGTPSGLFLTSQPPATDLPGKPSAKNPPGTQRSGFDSYIIPRLETGETETNRLLWVKTQRQPRAKTPDKAPCSIVKLAFKKESGNPLKDLDVSTFVGENLVPGLDDNRLTAAVKDNGGQVWVGTRGKGIIVYRPNRRDWIPHGQIFDTGIFPASLDIRSLAADGEKSFVYAVTAQGGLFRFKPVPVPGNGQTISPEVIIPGHKVALGNVHDAAFLDGMLYFAGDRGLYAYCLERHAWKKLTRLEIVFFQQYRDSLYALAADGRIVTVPAFQQVPVPGNEKAAEFYLPDGIMLIKTVSGKLYYNGNLLIPNSSAGGKNFCTQNIVSVTMDQAGGKNTLAWIATPDRLALYHTGRHHWLCSTGVFHPIRKIYYGGSVLWVHCGNGGLYLAEPLTLKELAHKSDVLQVTFAAAPGGGQAFVIQNRNGGKRLISIDHKGKENVLISATSFQSVRQHWLNNVWWESRDRFLYLAAGSYLGRYRHWPARSWQSVNLSDEVLQLQVNGPTWAHTRNGTLFMLSPDWKDVRQLKDVTDFTITGAAEASAYALTRVGGLVKTGPGGQDEIISNTTAPFEEVPRGKSTICIDEGRNRLYFLSPRGLSTYTMSSGSHRWQTDFSIHGSRVHFNGVPWVVGPGKLKRIDPEKLRIAASYTHTGGPVAFGSSTVVYKTPGDKIQATGNTGNYSVTMIGDSFKNFDRSHIKRIRVHPSGQYLYFGAFDRNRGAVGRYHVAQHHWQTADINGETRQLALENGRLWCCTADGDLYLFNAEEPGFNGSRVGQNVSRVIPYRKSAAILQDGKVLVFAPESRTFNVLAYNNAVTEKDFDVKQVELTGDYIFIATRKSLWKYHIPSHRWSKIDGVAGFRISYAQNRLWEGNKIYSSIRAFNQYIAALDVRGRLAVIRVDGNKEVFSRTGALKFQCHATGIYYLTSDGFYRLPVNADSLIDGMPPTSSIVPEKLLGNGKSHIGRIAAVYEDENLLYFGSTDGIVQTYRPSTHEWLDMCRVGNPVRRIEFSGSSYVVETEENRFFELEKMKIAAQGQFSEILDWFGFDSRIWLLRPDGIYIPRRVDIQRISGNEKTSETRAKAAENRISRYESRQAFGRGRASFESTGDIRQAFQIRRRFYFLNRDGTLDGYDTGDNGWDLPVPPVYAVGGGYAVKGRGNYRAYRIGPREIRFAGSQAPNMDLSIVPPVNKGKAPPVIENFEVGADAVYVLADDGRVFKYHRRSGNLPRILFPQHRAAVYHFIWQNRVFKIHRPRIRVTAITLTDGKLYYRLAPTPYTAGGFFAYTDSAPAVGITGDQFNEAAARLVRKREEETRTIVQADGSVKLPHYTTTLTPGGEWAHDRFHSLARLGETVYLFSDAGVARYSVFPGSRTLVFGAFFSYENFLTQSRLDNDWQWVPGKKRIVRRDRFHWLKQTRINGFPLTLSRTRGVPRIRHDLAPGRDLLWNRGFLWDTVLDFGVDDRDRIWLSHPGAVITYDTGSRRMQHWLPSRENVTDFYFPSGRNLKQPLAYCRAGGSDYRVDGTFDTSRRWLLPVKKNIYRELQTRLAENREWRFLRDPDNKESRVFYRDHFIRFSQGGRLGFDQVNDLAAAPGGDLLLATQGGIYNSDTRGLERFGFTLPVNVTRVRRHPQFPGNRELAVTIGGRNHTYDPSVPGVLNPVSPETGQLLRTLVSDFVHPDWTFKTGGWQRNGHVVTFTGGRFGFDRVVHFLAEPVIFLTSDGIWQYRDGAMEHWLSGNSVYRGGQRIVRSAFDPGVVYLESLDRYYRVNFKSRGGFTVTGPESESACIDIRNKENSIATDRAYAGWHFPSRAVPGANTYMSRAGKFYPVSFKNRRFGFDAVNDLQWDRDRLLLATADGIVHWDFSSNTWYLFRHPEQNPEAGTGGHSIYRWLKWRDSRWPPPADTSRYLLTGIERLFRTPRDRNLYASPDRDCSGHGFILRDGAYRFTGPIATQWRELRQTLMKSGNSGPWQFQRKNGTEINIRYRNKPVTLKNGRFGFNRLKYVSATTSGLLLVTDESREKFLLDGQSTGIQLTAQVGDYRQLETDPHTPSDWLVNTGSGFLFSSDGTTFSPLPAERTPAARDVFAGHILTDRLYPGWTFHKKNGFRRAVSSQGTIVDFTIDGGRVSFDRLSGGMAGYAVAMEADRIWYVTELGSGICMSKTGEILYEFHPRHTDFSFSHIYDKTWHGRRAALLASTSGGGTMRWNRERAQWDEPPTNSEPGFDQFKNMLLKNRDWEIIRTGTDSPMNVHVLASTQGGGVADVPLELSPKYGFSADFVNDIVPLGDRLVLATRDGLRALPLGSRGWPSHIYYRTTPQPRNVEEIRFQDRIPWIRIDGRQHYLGEGVRWKEETAGNGTSPFAVSRLETANWIWYLEWQTGTGCNKLDLRSRLVPGVRRRFSREGNFTDNLVYDFDAEADKILVSSRAGVSLYDAAGKMLFHLPRGADSEVLRQGSKWYIGTRGNRYFSIDGDLAVAPSDSKPFDRQVISEGWGSWYKNRCDVFSFRLHGKPLGTTGGDTAIFSKKGRFTFDQIRQILMVGDSLWAVTETGIVRFRLDRENALPLSEYHPFIMTPPVQAVSFKSGELYFVGKRRTVGTANKPNQKRLREIRQRLKEMEVRSTDRQWEWRQKGKTFFIQYRDFPQIKRKFSNGRFVDDQPVSLGMDEDVICYKTGGGCYVLDKETLKLKSYFPRCPSPCKPVVSDSRFGGGKHRLQLVNRVLYLDNYPFGPGSVKLDSIFERNGQFWGLDTKYFYKINLPR